MMTKPGRLSTWAAASRGAAGQGPLTSGSRCPDRTTVDVPARLLMPAAGLEADGCRPGTGMRAAWYERQGLPEVLVVGDMPHPEPGPGEVRLRVAASGIDPSDLKKRSNESGVGMPYPRVIPHSDGAGVIDRVGEGVAGSRVGERVWCFGAQSRRPFGTAAQFVVVPADHAVRMPDSMDFSTGAALGIPALTAHRAVHAGGPVAGRKVLVHGATGATGVFAVGFARRAEAQVLATVCSAQDEDAAWAAGAHHVVRMDASTAAEAVVHIQAIARDGVHHVVEAALDANVDMDRQVLAQGGSIAAYATERSRPGIPFWQLASKNARILCLGSDDYPMAEKLPAGQEANALLSSDWKGVRIERRFSLANIGAAHRYAEALPGGRVIVDIACGTQVGTQGKPGRRLC